jgi:hypothetical protein
MTTQAITTVKLESFVGPTPSPKLTTVKLESFVRPLPAPRITTTKLEVLVSMTLKPLGGSGFFFFGMN